MARRLSILAANAQADALARLLDGGLLRIYTGEQPTAPEAIPPAAELLYEFRLPNPSANAAAAGAISFQPSVIERARVAGTMAWFRMLSAAEQPLVDGSVGTDSGDLRVPMVDVAKDVRLSIDELLYVIDRGVLA